ncbi:uncharacterized protein [Procambarus clarkii]|uniref:uncharacterized protein n=1 Tax=Procambarus clarkii TaxID=6728 RepID=UPI003742A435
MAHQELQNIQDGDTSYVCGECFQLFTSMEYFNYHHCTPLKYSTASGYQEVSCIEESFSSLDEKDYGSTGTETVMDEAVATILGEKMDLPESRRNSCSMTLDEPTIQLNTCVANNKIMHGPYQPLPNARSISQFEGSQMDLYPAQYVEQSIEHLSIVDQHVGPVVEHIVENIENTLENTEEMHFGPGMTVESVEIPSSNVYIFDNPVYLNRLMKDNTCGKRVRHDAPYIHRLGPWDDKSSQLLIHLLKVYPEAYFIWGKNCKRTEAWELIRYKLSEAGHHFTVLQIRMRWRELCKRYRNIVNHNDQHDTKRTCQYFDDLNDLFGVWDSKATLLLIRELGANPAKRFGQNGGTRMRYKTWKQVQDALSEHGYEYTAHQVHGRWNALVTLYRKMAEHNCNESKEIMTVAYQDAIETVFKYVPERKSKLAKIRAKQGQTVKEFQKKWTLHAEQILLRGYKEKIELFIKSKNKREVWEQIVKMMEDDDHHTSVEKVRTRFYELSKQYEAVLRHNSQPGTLYRESKHHEILADIYSSHNCWPHDGSTMKSDNSSSLRLRQMKAQMVWSDEESRAVLTLYPQVLIEHLRNGDQPPLEELWVQLAKYLFSTHNFFKQPYEIEEHVALLRQGYKSQNPFPFRAEMELLEETERTLCFSPESPSTVLAQVAQYWSHSAAHCMLNYVIHYYQEGIKVFKENLFDIINDDMKKLGYRYTTEECRQFYQLLKKIYKKKVEVLKEGKDTFKLCPYMDKMEELEAAMIKTEFTVTDKVYMKTVTAASSSLEEIEGSDEKSKRASLEVELLRIKMQLMHVDCVSPLLPVKGIAHVLLKFLNEENSIHGLDNCINLERISTILHPHINILNLISQSGLQCTHYKSQPDTARKLRKTNLPHKSGSIKWTTDNICIMLDTVKEWQLLCHDDAEVEATRAEGHPMWNEVAYRLSRRYKKCPNVCQKFFTNLCHNYVKYRVSRSSSTKMPETLCKNKKIKNLLHTVLSRVGSCDAEWDIRDVSWASETSSWTMAEILELLFTVRELWSGGTSIDWKQVSLMMKAGGHQREANCCYSKFHQLYSGYQAAYAYNQKYSIRERRRPSFYFKIHSLFGYREIIPGCDFEPVTSEDKDLDVDEQEVIEVLLAEMKDMKGLTLHSVPRLPLLLSLSHFLDEHYQHRPNTFTPYQIWHLLVQLHNAQLETVQEGSEGPFGADLDGLWQGHSSPLQAYGLHAVPLPGWQLICDWSEAELDILTKSAMEWKMNSSQDISMSEVFSEALKAENYNKTAKQCRNQWHYMINVVKHGGYQRYKNHIDLVSLLQTSLPKQTSSCKNKSSITKLCKERKNVSHSFVSYGDRNSSQNLDQNMPNVFVTNRTTIVERENINVLPKDSQVSEHSNAVDNLMSLSEISNNVTEGKLKNTVKSSDEKVIKKRILHLLMTNISKKDKILVEVLSIAEKDNFNVIECQAEDGHQKRILKLHYPVKHTLPTNVKYITIPKMLVYPAYIDPAAQDSPILSTKRNGRESYCYTSDFKLTNHQTKILECATSNLRLQIREKQRYLYRGSHKGRLRESSIKQVKINGRVLSVCRVVSKNNISRIILKMKRRGSQLQMMKTRKVLKLALKKQFSEY